MIRVLELVARLEIGGSEGQAVRLLEGLDRTRFAPHVACLRAGGPLLAAIEARGIEVTAYPAPHLYGPSALRQQLRLAAALRSDHIDIVHATGFYTNVFAIPAARLARTPVIIGSVREQTDQWSPAQVAANRVALALADCIVVNASSVRDSLVEHGFPPHKVRVIRNGIDVGRFARRRGAGALRDELGWPAGTPIVAVISRVAPKKGIEQFLEAAARVAASRRDARFLVVGDGAIVRDGEALPGGRRGGLEARAAELGIADRVRFTGFRLDVPELLAQIDIAVVPSLSEALSNSLLEAMAAAAPVVATRVGDHERVVQDGVSGLLVPPGDVDALVKRILQLLGDPARAARLGEAARATVHARFSGDRMVRETEALYTELLARDRAPTAQRSRVEVETVRDAAGLHALAGEWDALHARSGHDHPFVTHAWASTWWQAFGADHELNVLVARRGGECIGIAPLMRSSTTQMYGVPVKRLELLGNVHTPRNDLLCAEPAAYDALIGELARTRATWDVLVLPQLVEGSPTIDAVSRLAAEHHVRTGLWMASPSPVLHLDRELALSPKMRANLRNRARKLAELGAVGIETITGGPDVDAALRDVLRLEAAAWKSANGTAITSWREVEHFYTALAGVAAARGWLELTFLTLGGRRISCAYSLRFGTTLFVLKQGYEPELGHCSPGMLMFERMIETARRQGLAAMDFLGDDEEWKLSWGAEPRRHGWLFGFAPSPRARLLHALKFTVAPAIRERRAHVAAHA